jgi:predicted negative regulator of RcsB-dependent stress response
MKNTIAVLLIITGSLFAIGRLAFHIYCSYQYKNEIQNLWTLSDRASTITQKSEYMNKFVDALEKQNLHGVNSALFLPTPENDFDENFKAVKSLQKRLTDISGMDENSFAYQTALQQITAQEQGEAKGMLDEFASCWDKVNHYTDWNWLLCLFFLVLQIGMIITGCAIYDRY